jgi:hypothetical protein
MTNGGKMTLEGWLSVADRAYFGAAVIALIATAVTIVAGVAQNRLSARISDNKDRAFNEFRVTSETRVAELQKLTAEANQKAEEERLARVKIEARLAPRSVSPEQFAAIVSALAPFPATPISIWQAGETPEIGSVARTVLAATQAARWDANLWTWTGVGSFLGLIVATKPGATSEITAAAEALTTALNAAGLRCVKQDWPTGSPWESVGGMHNGPQNPGPTQAPIRIVIGAKPDQ